jgi:hypothetical protein
MTLVERVCTTLEHGGREEQADALTTAIFLIEKGIGRSPAGWDEEVLSEPLDEDALSVLRKAVVAYAERNLRPVPVASAIAALALFEDEALKPLFQSFVRQYAAIGSDMGVLYQAMVALQRIGEKVFPDGRSSLRDIERNLELASAYLQKNP